MPVNAFGQSGQSGLASRVESLARRLQDVKNSIPPEQDPSPYAFFASNDTIRPQSDATRGTRTVSFELGPSSSGTISLGTIPRGRKMLVLGRAIRVTASPTSSGIRAASAFQAIYERRSGTTTGGFFATSAVQNLIDSTGVTVPGVGSDDDRGVIAVENVSTGVRCRYLIEFTVLDACDVFVPSPLSGPIEDFA